MMELRPRFRGLPASTQLEWADTSWLSSFHATRVWLERMQPRLAKMSSERLVAQASQALLRAAEASPQLSTDTTLDRCQSRMLDAVHAMRARPFRAPSLVASVPQARSRLPASGDSAYQLTPIG
jgi:hypothetical protein